MSYTVIDGLV